MISGDERTMKRVNAWIIRGYDSTAIIFEERVPMYLMSKRQISEVLRRLVSRQLSEREILAASKNRGCNSLLEVQEDSKTKRLLLSCGSNPFYTAEANGNNEL